MRAARRVVHLLGTALLVFAASAAAGTAFARDAPSADDAARTERRKEASVHFKRAVTLYEEGDYKIALAEFKRAYELDPTFHVLYNIGQASFQLRAYADAQRAFESYLAEAGDKIPAQRRDEVTRELDALRVRTARITIKSAPGAGLLLDGEKIGTGELEGYLVDAGTHRVSASMNGGEPTAKTITLAGGDATLVELPTAVPLTPPREPAHAEPANAGAPEEGRGPIWIGWVVTGAFAATTVGFTVAWLSADSELDTLKGRVSSAAERQGAASDVDTFRALTFVGLGATALAAGLSLYFTLKPAPRTVGQRSPFVVTPVATSGGGGIAIAGSLR